MADPGQSVAFAAICFEFRCAGELLAYGLSQVMTDRALLNC
jgi:hypothetical protein